MTVEIKERRDFFQPDWIWGNWERFENGILKYKCMYYIICVYLNTYIYIYTYRESFFLLKFQELPLVWERTDTAPCAGAARQML